MKFNRLFVAVSFSVAYSAQALPGLSREVPTVSGSSASACANFEGRWKGKCPGIGDERIELGQSGCSALWTGNGAIFLPIGGSRTEVISYPPDYSPLMTSSTHVTTSRWNRDKSKLHFTLTAVTAPGDKSGETTFSASGEMRKTGNNLEVLISSRGKSYLCTYYPE